MNENILSDLVITKVLSVVNMYTPENTKSKRNNRRSWAIVIKYEGETVYTSGGKNFRSDLNHMVILPKGCYYDWLCTRAGHFFIIEFDSEKTYPEPLSFYIKNPDNILHMFKELEYKRNLKKSAMELESIKDTYQIIISLVSAEAERYMPSDKQDAIAFAVEYISRNYNKTVSNDELAAVAGMSTVYFRKVFTRIMGISPIAYVHRLRIRKAKEMLKSDYGTLSDIAKSLGYSGLYDFSRDFKKHTGISPSKF